MRIINDLNSLQKLLLGAYLINNGIDKSFLAKLGVRVVSLGKDASKTAQQPYKVLNKYFGTNFEKTSITIFKNLGRGLIIVEGLRQLGKLRCCLIRCGFEEIERILERSALNVK